VDETFKQLIGETRAPLPMRPGLVERYDYMSGRETSLALAITRRALGKTEGSLGGL
jgi:hypothetical protein